MPLVAYIIIIAVLMLFSAFFSMCDMAFSSVNILRLKKAAENGSKTASVAYDLAKGYDNTISTILFYNNITNIGVSSLMVGTIAYANLGDFWSELVSIVISIFILLMIGEVLPKQLAKVYNYKLCLTFAYILNTFKIIAYPLTFVFTKFAGLLAKPIIKANKKNEDEDEEDLNDELHEMIDAIEDEGVLDENAAEIVRNSIEFNSTEAYEVMTPRVDVIMIDKDTTSSEIKEDKELLRYSRIPVYDDDKDNVIGILPMRLVQRYILNDEEFNINDLIVTPIFVPRSMMITDILKLFKSESRHMAVVLDEYGGVEGIVTIEDIIEELVGPVFDETDDIVKEYSITKDGTYIVDGSMNIDDFFDLIEYEPDFDDPSFNTVSGWVTDILQRFASVGDTFEYENIKVEVLNVDDYFVDKIKVSIINKDE